MFKYCASVVVMSSVYQSQSAQSREWGRCCKRALCLCHRSDYLPSFHHEFKENNHGFVFYSHARPLRPKNAGENQNQRESETGTSGSTERLTPDTDTGNTVVFLPFSAVIPAIVSCSLAFFLFMDCFLCLVIKPCSGGNASVNRQQW